MDLSCTTAPASRPALSLFMALTFNAFLVPLQYSANLAVTTTIARPAS
jgi:hypothetical protein